MILIQIAFDKHTFFTLYSMASDRLVEPLLEAILSQRYHSLMNNILLFLILNVAALVIAYKYTSVRAVFADNNKQGQDLSADSKMTELFISTKHVC